jgi:hypothetical protein
MVNLPCSAYCESGKLCLQSHLLVPVSSAREPLCTTRVDEHGDDFRSEANDGPLSAMAVVTDMELTPIGIE